MSTIIWIHGDCLNPHNIAYRTHPAAPSLFVWDDALLTQQRISLKRIAFMYECLLELPCEIRRGDVAAQVSAFAHAHNATTIATVYSPSPRFAAIMQAIDAQLAVEVLDPPPFVVLPGAVDLRRFHHYWERAKGRLLRK
jgi:hypothetical protein